MYPYRSDGYGYGAASSRSYQQQPPRVASSVASHAFEDDLPMYVLREDTLQSRYAVPSDRLQAQYYAVSGAGHYDESTLRGASQRYYDEGKSFLLLVSGFSEEFGNDRVGVALQGRSFCTLKALVSRYRRKDVSSSAMDEKSSLY